MKIQELLPHLKKGWVAMDVDGSWYWYKRKPYYNLRNGFWRISPADSFPCRLPREALPIEYGGDWKDSLMKCGVYSIKWNSKDVMPHPKDTQHIITKSGFEYQWLPTRDWKKPKNNGWYSYETDKMFVDCPEDWMDYDVWKKSLFVKCGGKK